MSTMDAETTVVIFRKWPASEGGGIIALLQECRNQMRAVRDALSKMVA
jgi:hypothetical protein